MVTILKVDYVAWGGRPSISKHCNTDAPSLQKPSTLKQRCSESPPQAPPLRNTLNIKTRAVSVTTLIAALAPRLFQD